MVKKIAMAIPAFIAVISLFLIWPGVSSAQDLAELEADHALTSEILTPHIDWAKPYARGKIRVLFFTDGRGTNPRECVELMQRFDIEAEAVFYSRKVDSHKKDWHGGKEGIKRMDALLEKDWDAFVFLGIAPAKMPEALRQRLIGKVQAGGGVLLSGVEDQALLPEGAARKESVPFLMGVAGVKAFALGKGRGVRLPARPVIDYAEGWQNTYESWQESLGRAVLWVTGREPDVGLSLSLTKDTFIRTEVAKLHVQLSGAFVGSKPILQLWIRRPVGWLAPWPDRELTCCQTIDLTLPRLPAGRYHLDGRVVGSAGVETWATIPFQVKSLRMITGIELNPGWGEIAGKIAGNVTLSGPADPGEIVRINVLDKDRRVLMRRDFAAGGDRVDFTFDIPCWMPLLATVEAVVMDHDEALAGGSRYFHVTRRNRNQFNFLIWDVPRGTLAPYAEECLARTGTTLQLAHGNPPLHVAANGIAWVPYTTHILAKPDASGVMTPFCWNDAAAVEKKTQGLADLHQPSRRHGVFVYSLGDEIYTKGACLARPCLEAYRGYLKEVYGDIDALNRSWGTDFAAWSEVGLGESGDNEEACSLKEKNYPRWFDRQAFKSYNFIQYALRYAQAYAGIDPRARTGFEGAGRFAGGDDIDLIVRHLGFWSPYPGTTDEVIRSIAPRDFFRANWMGYTKDADSLLQKYWRMVTLGMDAVWWWRWDCIGRFHGWLAPDLRPYQAVKELLADTQIVRDGFGDILLRSSMQDDGIGILYSYPSTFAHKLDEGAGFGDYEKTHQSWHKVVRNLGLQFSYVTDRMLRLSEFDPNRYSVLILPRAEAIGDKEAQVIREFVEGGGLVVADLRPGIYDDHCKKREKGVLDELFGVRRVGFLKAKTLVARGQKMSVALDPGIAAVVGRGRATADLDGVPALILRKVGKGHALLFNGDLNLLKSAAVEILSRFAIKSKGARQAALFDDAPLGLILLSLAGIKADIALKKEDGSAMRDVEVFRWENGKNEIMGLFRQGGKSEPVTVSLSKAGYVYDLRNRESLGYVRKFRTEILPNRASFFAVSPKPVPLLKMQLGGDGQKRGKVATACLTMPGAEGVHAVVVTARFPSAPAVAAPPSGDFFPRQGYPSANGSQNYEERDLLKRVVLVGNDPITIDFPIAFNDPMGDYEISATELFTNKTVTEKWTVR